MDWWSLGVGISGLVASALGLAFAYLASRAARSAEKAAVDARRAVAQTLSLVDVVRAVALIGRLKDVHYRGNWDYALGLYGDLRRTLSEIGASMPADWQESRNNIDRSVLEVTFLWDKVNRSPYENENGVPKDIPSLDETLNKIQQSLETLQSSMMYSESAVSS